MFCSPRSCGWCAVVAINIVTGAGALTAGQCGLLPGVAAFQRIEPSIEMTGLFRYMADAPVFTECGTGKRWPVAMEGAYRDLEAAYLQARRQPGEDLMSQVVGRVALRPSLDGGQPAPALVVERYIGVRPGETCGEPSRQHR
jgi:copper homeostasis protein (lipoprotein)